VIASQIMGREPTRAPTSIRNLDDVDVPIDVGPLLALDPYPIPVEADREHYCESDDAGYWFSGLRDFLKVQTAVGRHARPSGGGARLLDFGCASGRILRHAFCQQQHAEVWGCDIDRNHVEWIARHFPPSLRVFQNSAYPALPLPDASFDVVTGWSVFAHIDTFEDTWLLELRRILKPGGVACLSIHSPRSWSRITKLPHVLEAMLRCRVRGGGRGVDRRLFEGPMPSDRVVLEWDDDSPYRCNVFHTEEFIRGRWGRFFEVCAIYDGGIAGFQDVAVLRRE
jgi:SAM-dependent methyltransferase